MTALICSDLKGRGWEYIMHDKVDSYRSSDPVRTVLPKKLGLSSCIPCHKHRAVIKGCNP